MEDKLIIKKIQLTRQPFEEIGVKYCIEKIEILK